MQDTASGSFVKAARDKAESSKIPTIDRVANICDGLETLRQAINLTRSWDHYGALDDPVKESSLAAMPPIPAKPTVVALSLGHHGEETLLQDVCGRLMRKLAQKSELQSITNSQTALTLLNAPNAPNLIFVTDGAITVNRNRAVVQKLVELVRNGATVVIGGLFTCLVRPSDMDKLLGEKFGLAWRSGDYHRTTSNLNRAIQSLPQGLSPSYSQKAIYLRNVARGDAWYIPEEDARVESRVFGPTSVNRSQVAVAFTTIGSGRLGYVGDVNAEEETDAVVLGMLGLL